MPWNQSTYVGYVGEIGFSVVTCEAYFLVDGLLLLLFISICLYFRSFREILKNSIRIRNQFDGNRFDHEFLCDLIRFHISIKKWVKQQLANILNNWRILCSCFEESDEIYSSFMIVQLFIWVFGVSVVAVFVGMVSSMRSAIFLWMQFIVLATTVSTGSASHCPTNFLTKQSISYFGIDSNL